MAEDFRDRSRRIAPAAARRVSRRRRKRKPRAAAPQRSRAETKSAGRFFTPAQHTLVEELSETIIPADSHSGGAKAAKVADYIDQTLRETTDDKQKALWREGLRLIDLDEPALQRKIFRRRQSRGARSPFSPCSPTTIR